MSDHRSRRTLLLAGVSLASIGALSVILATRADESAKPILYQVVAQKNVAAVVVDVMAFAEKNYGYTYSAEEQKAIPAQLWFEMQGILTKNYKLLDKAPE